MLATRASVAARRARARALQEEHPAIGLGRGVIQAAVDRAQRPAEAGPDVGGGERALDVLDDRRRRAPRSLDRQHGELVAAQARDRVLGPDPPSQSVGAGDQQPVAGVVPLGVVDRLEPVEVDDDDDGIEAVALAAPVLGPQALIPAATVQAARQHVACGLALGPRQREAQAVDLLLERSLAWLVLGYGFLLTPRALPFLATRLPNCRQAWRGI